MGEFRMPSLGADMEYGTLVQWRVQPGAQVRRGDIVALVETQKGLFEVEIFEDGIIESLIVEAGTRVPVGTVLARLRASGETALTAMPMPTVAVRASPAARKLAAEKGIDLSSISGSGPGGAVTLADIEQAAARSPREAPHRARATPLARRVAAELHVDLGAVEGTGPGGAVTRTDVERTAGADEVAAVHEPLVVETPGVEAPAAETAPRSAEPDERTLAMRQAIAAAVSRSKREIPHYYLSTDIVLDVALRWLQSINQARPVAQRMLPAVLLVKAVALALQRYPEFNGFWIDGAFRAGPSINPGVAVSLRTGGLLVPAIRDADQKSLDELMRDLNDIVSRAREGRLRASDITDSTITITNLGDQGVETVFGVIYPPQVALLGFGKIRERAWAADGMIGVKPVITATLSADHRATDGHRGSLLMAEVARLLQAPEQL